MTATAVRIAVYGTLGVAIGVFSFLLVFTLWDGSLVSGDLISAHAQYINSTSPESISAAEDVAEVKSAISNDELLSKIISFYETIIQILIAAIGIIGFVAFMYIRAASLEHAENIIEEKIVSKFKMQEFHDLLKKYLSQSHVDIKKDIESIRTGLRSYLNDLEQYGDLAEKVSGLEKSVFALEGALSRLDKSEDDGEELSLIEAGENNGNA